VVGAVGFKQVPSASSSVVWSFWSLLTANLGDD